METYGLFASIIDQLDTQIHNSAAVEPAVIPSDQSPWLLAALLQKSIRRGRTDLALAAANGLLAYRPERLWRRLAVIAVEDVGLGNLDSVYLAVAAAAGWRKLSRRHDHHRRIGGPDPHAGDDRMRVPCQRHHAR